MNTSEHEALHHNIAKFHNQKDMDFNAESGVIYDPSSQGWKKHAEYDDILKHDQEVGQSAELVKLISELIDLIENIQLRNQQKADHKSVELLDEKKQTAKKMIQNTLEAVEKYIASIRYLDDVKLDRDRLEQSVFLEVLKSADKARKLKHNTLISHIHSTVRYISYNFGIISDKALEKWEEEQEEMGFEVLDLERVKFPSRNVFLPEKLDLDNRKNITAWAQQLMYSMSELKKLPSLSYREGS